MAQKYVAFGQLIDGEATLKAIESVPTFYESPTLNIQIERAGVLNLECDGIRVSKSTNEYIQAHIEDLIALGDLLMEVMIYNSIDHSNSICNLKIKILPTKLTFFFIRHSWIEFIKN